MTIEAIERSWFGLRERATKLPVGTSFAFPTNPIIIAHRVTVISPDQIEVCSTSRLTYVPSSTKVLEREKINLKKITIPKGEASGFSRDIRIRWTKK